MCMCVSVFSDWVYLLALLFLFFGDCVACSMVIWVWCFLAGYFAFAVVVLLWVVLVGFELLVLLVN